MRKVDRIITNDGSCFNTEKEARKYLDKKYGDQLTKVSHKILQHNKYEPLINFLDENIEIFEELICLKKEINTGIEKEEYDF